jgi:hypothetical protein
MELKPQGIRLYNVMLAYLDNKEIIILQVRSRQF